MVMAASAPRSAPGIVKIMVSALTTLTAPQDSAGALPLPTVNVMAVGFVPVDGIKPVPLTTTLTEVGLLAWVGVWVGKMRVITALGGVTVMVKATLIAEPPAGVTVTVPVSESPTLALSNTDCTKLTTIGVPKL